MNWTCRSNGQHVHNEYSWPIWIWHFTRKRGIDSQKTFNNTRRIVGNIPIYAFEENVKYSLKSVVDCLFKFTPFLRALLWVGTTPLRKAHKYSWNFLKSQKRDQSENVLILRLTHFLWNKAHLSNQTQNLLHSDVL